MPRRILLLLAHLLFFGTRLRADSTVEKAAADAWSHAQFQQARLAETTQTLSLKLARNDAGSTESQAIEVVTRSGVGVFRRLNYGVWFASDAPTSASLPALRALGIRTIFSVGPYAADQGLTEPYGIRVVHIPISLGGATRRELLTLTRALNYIGPPMYVHSTPRDTRGLDAALLLVAMMEGPGGPARAIELARRLRLPMVQRGQWDQLLRLTALRKSELESVPLQFDAWSPPPTLKVRMGRVQRCFELLREAKGRGWDPPPGYPGGSPREEALILEGEFRDLVADLDLMRARPGLRNHAEETADAARSLADSLQEPRFANPSRTYETLVRSCASCHRDERDR